MRCSRCQGCLSTDVDETRCLNCGWIKNEPYPEPIREPYWRKAPRKCRNCAQEAVLGNSYCQSCKDYMVDYRLKRKAGAR